MKFILFFAVILLGCRNESPKEVYTQTSTKGTCERPYEVSIYIAPGLSGRYYCNMYTMTYAVDCTDISWWTKNGSDPDYESHTHNEIIFGQATVEISRVVHSCPEKK